MSLLVIIWYLPAAQDTVKKTLTTNPLRRSNSTPIFTTQMPNVTRV